ncbi:hypothetical protein RN001_010872 [Aquatica leii]|uniref:ODAD1 central coiled coil region domain-containing protein n=1 Tax=Aquatica leii TaxID=1421715 RepID=A0AAN7PAA9_9COLE|nr:hypothetical protein RN001_010872 [Aquatica leii]
METPRKVISIEKQFEINVQLEKELGTVIKTYNNLENKSEVKSGGAKAANALKFAQLLRNEFYNVVTESCISKSGAKKIQDEKTYVELRDLLEERSGLEDRIKEQQLFLKEIDVSIDEKQNKIADIAHKVPSNVKWQQRVQRAEKTLEGLENKLDTVVKQYGVIAADTRDLREEIDHMLTERIRFNTLWYSYVMNLSAGKKILMDVVEQAVLAYNSRDEYIVRLSALRSLATNDLIRNSQEMNLLQQTLDNNRQVEEFVGLKQQYRNMKDLFEMKHQKRINQEFEIVKKIGHYKQVLEKIQDFVGVKCESSTTEFVDRFVSAETINMSYFNYINELHNELEHANQELVQRRTDIKNQEAVNENRAEHQKTNLNLLKTELNSKTKEIDADKKSLDGVDKVLKQIYSGLDKIFKLCKCNNGPFIKLLGENSSVNQYNVLLHIKVIEESVDNYLANVYYNEKVGSKGKSAKPVVPIIDEELTPIEKCPVELFCPTNPCPLCVDREMVSDVIDKLQSVETRDTVKTNLDIRLELPNALDRLHNVSACNLPKSRQIIQKRYQ